VNAAVGCYVAEITPPPGPQIWHIRKERIIPTLTGRS